MMSDTMGANMASDRLSVRLPQSLRQRINELSESTGKTESEIAREALEEYLDRSESSPTAYDVALKAGWIGCFDSGVGDLSTNPKHMEGFGK